MTEKTFDEIVKNFNHDKIDIPVDFDHSMEQPVANSLAKSTGNAPAAGWISALERRPDGLWGLTEWLPDTRKRILAKEYQFVSPAIRFGSTDPVTGSKVGAKLSSAGITNKPFLRALPPLQANDSSEAFLCSEITDSELIELTSSYSYGPNEFLPRFRYMLGLDELASSEDMIKKLDRLSELCDLAGGDATATVEGINLSDYVPRIRDFMRMPANTTLCDLLDAAAEMIESTIPDSEGADMSDTVSAEAQNQTDTDPAPVVPTTKETENNMETITLTDHESKLSAAVKMAVESAVDAAVATVNLKLMAETAKVTEVAAQLTEKDSRIVALTEQIEATNEANRASRIDEAFDSYKHAQKLTDLHKKQMKITLMSDPETFEALYPKLTADKRMLTGGIVTSGGSKPAPAAKKSVDFRARAAVLMSEKGIDHEEAFTLALKEDHESRLVG